MVAKLAEMASEVASLLDAPSAAVLAVYDAKGETVVSPVWFRADRDAFEIVIGARDRKLGLLRHDPRATLLIFETARPFRGVQVRGRVTIVPDDAAATRLAIASRYLGPADGARFADLARRPPGFVIGLPLADAIAWNLRDALPEAAPPSSSMP